MPLMTANAYWGLGLETTYGASVAPTLLTPIDSPKVTPGVTWLDDSNFRGSPVKHYDQVQGVFKATFDGKTFTYTDIYPQLLRAALGSSDTVTNAGGGMSVHTIGLQNSPNTGSQAPSYTVLNDSVDATYIATAGRCTSLSLSFSAEGAVENTFQFITNQPTPIANSGSVTPMASESVQHLVPSWACAASLGGVKSAVLESVQLDIKRSAAQIYTLGSQSAYSNFQGPIEVSGKISFVAEQGETVWTQALVRNQQQLLLNLVDPQTGYSILYQMSNVQLESPVITQSKAYVEVMTDFIAVANLTDTAPSSFGYSPILTKTTNGNNLPY